MIIFKEKAISVAQENCIMLEVGEGNGFVYLSKSTYDQALLLNDRLEGELSYLKKVLIGDATKHESAILYFYENAPEPLNILAPFLGLVKADVELEKNIRSLCGVLHEMSMAIDFNEFSKVPASVRADVEFGKSAIKKYEQSWADMEVKLTVDDIDLENISVEAVANILAKILPSLNVGFNSQGGSSVRGNYQSDEDEEDDGDNDEDDDEDFFAQLAAIAAAEDKKIREEEKEAAEKAGEQGAAAPVAASASIVGEPKILTEKEKELNEIDSLIQSLAK